MRSALSVLVPLSVVLAGSPYAVQAHRESAAQAPAAAEATSPKTVINLFNGKDLTGWKPDVPERDGSPNGPPSFIVRNGRLVSLGKPEGHLVTDGRYRDYRLEVEYRFSGQAGNCGVLVHASKPRALYKMFPQSIEVQLMSGNAGDFWVIREDIKTNDMEKRRPRAPGEKWGSAEGDARRILNFTDNSEKPLGEWNTLVIEARGRTLKVWLNGDYVNEGFDATVDQGRIALQAEGAEVEFRKVQIGPLPPEKRVVTAPGPKPVGPYSPGIVAGDFLYVSGQGARDRDGQLPAAVDAQVRQTLDNVKAIVEGAGLTLDHVVYSQVYLRDMAAYEQMDRIWREYFPKAPPARAVLGVYRMPTDTPVEISAVAIRDLARKKAIVPASSPRNISWTPGVLAGDRLYLSGAFGADAAGKVPESADAQVQLALDNMKDTLTAAGLDFRHVVFVNPYLTDKASGQMNAIYAKHFEFGNTPARATIRVASLPGGNTIQFTGVAVADLSKRVAVRPKNMRPSATASPCVWAGDTFYCSAKGPFTPGPDKVQGIFVSTVESQVRQSMRNLLDGLEEAGLSFSNVVASNVYLDNIDDFARMNRIYAQYFPDTFPTRTTVAPLAPIDRTPAGEETFPGLEQISFVAVR